jgi:hypothetical protein
MDVQDKVGVVVTVIVFLLFFACLLSLHSYDNGRESMKREAVAAGVAEYYPAEDGSAEWRWKSQEQG